MRITLIPMFLQTPHDDIVAELQVIATVAGGQGNGAPCSQGSSVRVTALEFPVEKNSPDQSEQGFANQIQALVMSRLESAGFTSLAVGSPDEAGHFSVTLQNQEKIIVSLTYSTQKSRTLLMSVIGEGQEVMSAQKE